MHNIAFVGQMASQLAPDVIAHLTFDYRSQIFSHDDHYGLGLFAADVQISSTFGSQHATSVLRLLQVPLAGLDLVDFESVPARAIVCNVAEHGRAVAEYALLAILSHIRRWSNSSDLSDLRSWWSTSSRTGGALMGDLSDFRVGVLGFGEIGKAVVGMCQAFAINVAVCNRTPIADSGVAFYALDNIVEFASSVDFLIVACALTPATRGIINGRLLSHLRPSCVLINVARAECVDELALYRACSRGDIGGAVLDVWYQYPTSDDMAPSPSKVDFAHLNNVVMTAHTSAWTLGTRSRRVRRIAENLNNFSQGLPLHGVVKGKEDLR